MPSIIKRKGAVTKCEGILSQLLFAFQNIFELLVEGYWLLVSKSYHILCLLTIYRLRFSLISSLQSPIYEPGKTEENRKNT